MCLHVNFDTKIEVANEDIICYKILRKGKEIDFKVYSLYMGFVYKLKTLYKLDGKLQIIPENTFDPKFGVYKGFHAYLCEIDALKEYYYHISRRCYFIGVYKCRIPKGANIVYGEYCNGECIASDAIEILEEIGENNDN